MRTPALGGRTPRPRTRPGPSSSRLPWGSEDARRSSGSRLRRRTPLGKTWRTLRTAPSPRRPTALLRRGARHPRPPRRTRTPTRGPPAATDRQRPRHPLRVDPAGSPASRARADPPLPTPAAEPCGPSRTATPPRRPRPPGHLTTVSPAMATTKRPAKPAVASPAATLSPLRGSALTAPALWTRLRFGGRGAGLCTRRRQWRHPASTRPSLPRLKAVRWTRPSQAGESSSGRSSRCLGPCPRPHRPTGSCALVWKSLSCGSRSCVTPRWRPQRTAECPGMSIHVAPA
mmetsp:Transcript_10202/g.39698  ORF Transcript_10202/g.39698 Transcript_10202/m.39698 type:complete len:287 (-) Transcript_10202:85-945(-)